MMVHKIIACFIVVVGIIPVAAQTDPSNIVCTDINSTTLQLTWDQATDVSVLGYYLHIERVDGLKIEPAIPSVDLNSKTYDNYDFYGLGKYGTYNITIHSYTSSANLTQYVTTCTTTEDVPDGTPLTFYCAGISTSAISCTWSDLAQVYWNGVPVGYRLQYLSSNVSALYEKTVDSNTTTTVVTGLYYGTSYMFFMNAYTSTGHGALYTTTNAATQGASEPVVENVTRYYCNEAVPGFLEFGWEEMPCTIYSGTIGALFVICGVFIGILACMSCCGKSPTNDVSLNFFNNPSSGKSRRHDNDDDDNDGHMSDDEQNDDYNDDGYENKGYRSDEDPRSPDGRKTESPGEDKNSPEGTPDIPPSRQSSTSIMDGNEQKKMQLERQLTARDVEIEEISENGDEISDSDYDTQSDTDVDEVWTVSNASVKGAAVLAVNTVRQVTTKEKKSSKGNKDSTTSSTDVNTKTGVNKQDINKSKTKTATTVALIHTERNARNTNNVPKDLSKKTECGNTRQHYNGSKDIELDPWGSPTLQNNQTDITPSRLSSRNIVNDETAPVEDDWDDNIVENKYTNDNGRLINSISKNTVSNNLPPSKKQRSNSSNEFELHSLESKSLQNNKISVNSSNTKTDDRKPTTANRKNVLRSPINDWDEGDGWGGVFIHQDKEGLETVSEKETGNNGKQFQSNIPVIQVSNNQIEKYSDWDDEIEIQESSILSGTQKVLTQVNESRFHKVDVVAAGRHNTSTMNKAKTQKVAEKTSDTEIPKLAKTDRSDNSEAKSSGNITTKGELTKRKHDKVNQNENQAAGFSTKAKENKKISFRDQQTNALKPKLLNLETSKAEHKNKFFIEDEIDNMNLPTEQIQRPNSEQNGKSIATKAWLPQSNNFNIKPGRKTPVKALPKVQSWTTVEIEPILGSDRLGKKFPFLNIDNESATSKIEPFSATSGNRFRKNMSESDLERSSSTHDTNCDVAVPKRISEGDVLSKFMKNKSETADKVFYGFGAGRFRYIATKWMAQFRAKKSQVKTVQSDWR